MRLGIWMVAGIFEKSKRFRLAVFCCPIYKAPKSAPARGPRETLMRRCDGDDCRRTVTGEVEEDVGPGIRAQRRMRSRRHSSPQAPGEASCNPVTIRSGKSAQDRKST